VKVGVRHESAGPGNSYPLLPLAAQEPRDQVGLALDTPPLGQLLARRRQGTAVVVGWRPFPTSLAIPVLLGHHLQVSQDRVQGIRARFREIPDDGRRPADPLLSQQLRGAESPRGRMLTARLDANKHASAMRPVVSTHLKFYLWRERVEVLEDRLETNIVHHLEQRGFAWPERPPVLPGRPASGFFFLETRIGIELGVPPSVHSLVPGHSGESVSARTAAPESSHEGGHRYADRLWQERRGANSIRRDVRVDYYRTVGNAGQQLEEFPGEVKVVEQATAEHYIERAVSAKVPRCVVNKGEVGQIDLRPNPFTGVDVSSPGRPGQPLCIRLWPVRPSSHPPDNPDRRP
jgi:hypothetical protein